MKNKTIFILILIILIGVIIFKNDGKNEDIIVDDNNKQKIELNKLKDIITKSEYFSNAIYKEDLKENKLTINDLEVYMKDGNYLMKLDDSSEIEDYCKIVDAIETNLGNNKSESIKTCKYTISKKVDLGGISVENVNNQIFLTVNSKEKSKIIGEDNKKSLGEFISVDEINYYIEEDDILLTSPLYEEDSEKNIYKYSINIYSELKELKLELKFYDSDKVELDKEIIEYERDTDSFKTIYHNNSINKNKIAYYTIKPIK